MSVRLVRVVLATSGVLAAVAACGTSSGGDLDSGGAGVGGAAGGSSNAKGGAAATNTGGRASGGANLGGAGASSGLGGAAVGGSSGSDFGGEGSGDGGAGAGAAGASQGGQSNGGNTVAGAGTGGVGSGGASFGGSGAGGKSSGGSNQGGGNAGGSQGGGNAGGGGGGKSSGGAASGGASGAAGGAGTGGQGGGQPVSCGSGPDCGSGQVCLQIVVTMGPGETTTYQCAANPCGSATLACSCAGETCHDANVVTTCTLAEPAARRLRCTGGGVCAAPDTPIATPDGDRPIAALKPGDLVYSVNDNRFLAVPLLRVSRTPVSDHVVVHLETERGARLDVSAPHPTADGRTFADLRVGDRLDGATIIVRELVAYAYDATYDILPASSTGAYVASGLLIGSSLK